MLLSVAPVCLMVGFCGTGMATAFATRFARLRFFVCFCAGAASLRVNSITRSLAYSISDSASNCVCRLAASNSPRIALSERWISTTARLLIPCSPLGGGMQNHQPESVSTPQLSNCTLGFCGCVTPSTSAKPSCFALRVDVAVTCLAKLYKAVGKRVMLTCRR